MTRRRAVPSGSRVRTTMPRGVSSAALRLLLHQHEQEPAVPRRPACYGGCCPPVTWLLLCAGAPLCATVPAQATVKVAGSAWLRVQPASAVTTIPSSSPGAPARARASCSRAHTCVRVHAHPPPVVATCSPKEGPSDCQHQ